MATHESVRRPRLAPPSSNRHRPPGPFAGTLHPASHGPSALEPVLVRLSRLGSWAGHRAAWFSALDRLIEEHDVGAANEDGEAGPGG